MTKGKVVDYKGRVLVFNYYDYTQEITVFFYRTNGPTEFKAILSNRPHCVTIIKAIINGDCDPLVFIDFLQDGTEQGDWDYFDGYCFVTLTAEIWNQWLHLLAYDTVIE
jgi:hypothetical protein